MTKKDISNRFCLDNHQLNKITLSDAFPLLGIVVAIPVGCEWVLQLVLQLVVICSQPKIYKMAAYSHLVVRFSQKALVSFIWSLNTEYSNRLLWSESYFGNSRFAKQNR